LLFEKLKKIRTLCNDSSKSNSKANPNEDQSETNSTKKQEWNLPMAILVNEKNDNKIRIKLVNTDYYGLRKRPITYLSQVNQKKKIIISFRKCFGQLTN
jgi:hypothetical protein